MRYFNLPAIQAESIGSLDSNIDELSHHLIAAFVCHPVARRGN
jgi:hypothetical protein